MKLFFPVNRESTRVHEENYRKESVLNSITMKLKFSFLDVPENGFGHFFFLKYLVNLRQGHSIHERCHAIPWVVSSTPFSAHHFLKANFAKVLIA